MGTDDKLQSRLAAFVDWIRTEPDREDEIRERAENVRAAIKAKAVEDGLVVRSTPRSGSFATKTGLRRHMRGDAEVEGQDVDVPFVVSPRTKDEEQLSFLLPRFEGYAKEAYPDTERERTKSSIRLLFSDHVHFDLVPMLATKDPERQILVRSDGERRETSVQKHVEFIRGRTEKSNVGYAEFNELVRLLKWWRCFRLADGGVLKEVPSFLVNLLAAQAFDHRGVQATYAATIADWFGFLARAVRKRSPISFKDYGTPPKGTTDLWLVIDPVSQENNIVSKWDGLMCDELAEWFEEARDAMSDAIVAFDDDRETDGLEHLVAIFGSPVLHHSEGEQ